MYHHIQYFLHGGINQNCEHAVRERALQLGEAKKLYTQPRTAAHIPKGIVNNVDPFIPEHASQGKPSICVDRGEV